MKYCETARKPGGKRRKQISTCSIGRNRFTRLNQYGGANEESMLFIFVMFFAILGCAGMQARPSENLEKIVEIPGFTKNQIFDQTKIYIAENFKSAKAVLEYENKETGTIIGNGRIPFPTGGGIEAVALKDWTAPFTLRIDIKEERFRCTFTNIAIEWPAQFGAYAHPAGGRSVFYAQEFERISREILNIPSAIESSIKRSKTKDNW